MRSPTARDAAEGLAEIEDVLVDHRAGRISGSLAASTIGLMFLKHQGPLLAALRSAGTEGGETQGAEAMRGLAVATCCAMAKEAHGKARADHKQLGMKLQWLATAEAAEFLATAIRGLPLPALHARTTDGGEA